MNRLKVEHILKRVIAFVMALLCCMSLFLSCIRFSEAAKVNLNTNSALGSPVLNVDAVSDDWNKYEIVVWGIFLSNLCVPFIDDYESAFSLYSNFGSKGAGTNALNFGSGSDIQNSKVLQDLTSYAIDYQKQMNLKPIQVSFSRYNNGIITCFDSFTDTTGITPGTACKYGTSTVAFVDDTLNSTTRPAKLADLFYVVSKDGNNDSTWSVDYSKSHNFEIIGYSDFNFIEDATIPTFAVSTPGGTEIVLDYKDTYDMQLIGAAMSNAFTQYSTVADTVASTISTNLDNALYLDGFGNICVQSGNRYIVVIPASANQYLKQEKSLNLVTSLLYNCDQNVTNTDNMVMFAGNEPDGSILGLKWYNTGSLAFTKKCDSMKDGGIMLFYDTDSWVADLINAKMLSKSIESSAVYGFSDSDVFGTDITMQLSDMFMTFYGSASLGTKKNNIQSDIRFPLKMQTVNCESIMKKVSDSDIQKMLVNTLMVTGGLCNFMNNGTAGIDKLTEMKQVDTDGSITLYKDSFVVPVNIDSGSEKGGKYDYRVMERAFANHVYKSYISDKTEPAIKSELSNIFKPGAYDGWHQAELYDSLCVAEGNKVSHLVADFMTSNSKLYTVVDSNAKTALTSVVAEDSLFRRPREVLDGVKLSKYVKPRFQDANVDTNLFTRQCKVYPISSVLEAVSNVFSCRDGYQFAQYAANIYLTYLDWYGIETTKTGVQKADLNPKLFPDTAIPADIADITDELPSEEEMERVTKEYAYLMLHPVDGQQYRQQMVMNSLNNFLYDQYQRIVYGGSTEYYQGLVTSRNSTGFLDVPNYSENFLTSFVIKIYPTLAIVLIAIGAIAAVLVFAITRRKVSWLLVNIFMVGFTVLILPSSGEFVPYLSNQIVEDMFKDKMTYWAISEQAENNYSEEALAENNLGSNYLGELTGEEKAQALSLMNQTKQLYLDRYINIKQDISNKVTSTNNSNYSNYQELKSTRWMLPLVMRQYSGDDGTAEYVYVSMSDKIEDCSNMFWFYIPMDARDSKTSNASSDTDVVYGYELGSTGGRYGSLQSSALVSEKYENIADAPDVDSFMVKDPTKVNKNYIDITSDISKFGSLTEENVKNFRHYSFTGKTVSPLLTHTYFYMLDCGDKLYDMKYVSNMTEADGIGNLSEALKGGWYNSGGTIDVNLAQIAQELVYEGGAYQRYDRDTMHQSYGYLWSTESPLLYMYMGVKDTFDRGMSKGLVVKAIQGSYTETDTGIRYRQTFMTDPDNGQVRDIIDLETMFTNFMPYMYSLQCTAEGYDGKSGALGKTTIKDFADETLYPSVYCGLDREYFSKSIYKDNLASWLFCCNWVTKIMEGSYSTSAVVRDSSGTEYTVANQLIPNCYPSNRPMVFSDAQKVALGLEDDDLSLVELKCISINNNISRRWTMLINYINKNGVTKEVIFRQMALEATMEFCQQFTSFNVFTSGNKLYPSSLDLRSISFDSIMCMLMLNVTNNSSFIYNDTMKTIISDYSIVSSFLLFIAAILCAAVVPFVRKLGLAIVFYAGLVSVILNLFKDTNSKVKTSVGWTSINAVMLASNILYLLVFKIMTNLVTTDQVLDVDRIAMNSGSPVICFAIVIAISILYTWWLLKISLFTINNYKDMGAEVFKQVWDMTRGKIRSAASSVSNKIRNTVGGASGSSTSGSRGGSQKSYDQANDKEKNSHKSDSKDSGGSDKSGGSGNSGKSGGSGGSGKPNSNDSSKKRRKHAQSESSYNNSTGATDIAIDASEIDADINKGREAQAAEDKNKQAQAAEDKNKQA